MYMYIQCTCTCTQTCTHNNYYSYMYIIHDKVYLLSAPPNSGNKEAGLKP